MERKDQLVNEKIGRRRLWESWADHGNVGKGQSWITQMPIKLRNEEVEPFIRFLIESLHEGFGTATSIELEEKETSEGPVKKVRFLYAPPDRNERTENDIIVKRKADIFGVELSSVPSENAEEMVQQTGTYVRKIALEWNITR